MKSIDILVLWAGSPDEYNLTTWINQTIESALQERKNLGKEEFHCSNIHLAALSCKDLVTIDFVIIYGRLSQSAKALVEHLCFLTNTERDSSVLELSHEKREYLNQRIIYIKESKGGSCITDAVDSVPTFFTSCHGDRQRFIDYLNRYEQLTEQQIPHFLNLVSPLR